MLVVVSIVAVAIGVAALATHSIYDDSISFANEREFNGNAVLVLSSKFTTLRKKIEKFLQFTCRIISNTLEEIVNISV